MDFLNEDLTTIDNVTPFLKQCIGKGKEIAAGSILQIQQVTNISFPTSEKPNYNSDQHTLKLTVTDGQTQAYALVSDGCPGVSLNTPPGTKIRANVGIPVQGSLFVLNRSNCEVIGGRVGKLIERWEVQKKTAIKHEWGYAGTSVEGEGPPTWRPFGYKSQMDVAALRKMKTIDVVSEKKDGKATESKSQFDLQRDEAISELQGTANKQKFQKPNKHLLDKEITDIMEEGFSQNDAEYAMNKFKNTQKAIKFLKDAKKRQEGPPKEFPKAPPVDRRPRKGRGRGQDEDEDADVPPEYQRPTRSISLFGFIEGAIKTDDSAAPATAPASNGPAHTTAPSSNYRSRDLEDGMNNLSLNRGPPYGRNERGGRGRGGFRGRGSGRGDFQSRRGGHFNQDSYFTRSQQSQNRYDRGDRDSQNRFDRGDRDSQNRYDRGDRDSQSRFDRGDRDSHNRFDRDRDSHSRYDRERDSQNRYDRDREKDRDRDRDSRRFEDKGAKGDGPHIQKPPRFQKSVDFKAETWSNSEYQPDATPAPQNANTGATSQPSSSSISSGSFSSRGQSRDGGYESGSSSSYFYPQDTNHPHRTNISYFNPDDPGAGSYQQRPATAGKDRVERDRFNSEFSSTTQQYQRSSDYPVPSFQSQYQNPSGTRNQYMGGGNNGGGQNHHDSFSERPSGQHRPHTSYTNHSNFPAPTSEFTQYQYGCDEWNPAKSMVFTRSKPEGKDGRTGGVGSGGVNATGRHTAIGGGAAGGGAASNFRGAQSQGYSSSYNNRSNYNRY